MITQNEFDQYIYHFTKSKTATKYILPSLRLKLSPFNKTNDPKEHRTFGFHIDNLEKLNVFDTIKLNDSLINYVNKRCKLTCFSHDYIYKKTLYFGYNLPRMWAQYADKHKGVCFVISQELLKKENSDLIKSDKYFAEVNYKDKMEYPDFKENEYLENNNKYFETFVDKNLANLFLTKFIDSQTEHETRLIHVGTKKYCSIKNSPVFDTFLLQQY